jgi:uncharacterized protein YjbJ (UPF0337 family)
MVPASGTGVLPTRFLADNTNRQEVTMINKDQVRGAAKQAKGTAKEAAGKVTGDRREQAKGKAEKTVGKVQKAYGELKEKVKDEP